MDRQGGDGRGRPLLPATTPVPLLFLVAGGGLALLAGSQFLVALLDGGPAVVALLDLLFVGIPGATLVYVGRWLPRSDITQAYYSRIAGWVLGGVVVMFAFIALRDAHPGVTVEWTIGTQAIGLMVGSVGGLLVGVQETRVRMRTEQLEERTRELTRRERQLERQNERLEEFADVVSHDLRNPLNVADGRLALAREAHGDGEHLEGVAAALERMDALVEDLLALARDGDDVADPEPVDLGALAGECWTNVDTAEATLAVDVDRTAVGDRSRMKQLLENLFRNAVEHGGADVGVSVGALEDGFYVEDTGPGVPEADRAAVFETGYSTAEGGTGFGLRIVEQVVDAHGWDVRVVEGTDGGARFEVTGVEWG